MSKIKVFLVEDEIVIRNGIKNSIEWEKEGYIFVGEASDGELAYPIILKEKPDILITDIRMPFMDGLELSRLVKKELPDIKILILSGYDEFDYAKEAIRIGVTEYMLKPVSSVKLLEALKRVCIQIEQEREEKELLRKYSEEMKENIELEKVKFFEKLVSGEMSMIEALEEGKRFKMNLSARMYEIILFKILFEVNQPRKSALAGRAEDTIEEMIDEIPYIYSFQRGVDGWAFLLIADDEMQMKERVAELRERVRKVMERWDTLEYFGGIGSPVTRLRELRKAFREAEKAFAARFTSKSNVMVSVEEVSDGQKHQEMENFEMRSFGEVERTRAMLEKFLNNGTSEEVECFTDAYMKEIPEDNLRSTLMRQYIIMDIYIVIMSFCERMDMSDKTLKEETKELKSTMEKIHSIDEIKKYLTMFLSRAIEIRDTVSGRRYSDIIDAAKEQIADTYMSEEISLNTVAASVGMSPSYFSSIFSREAGMTFVEYLTETRMEKAKELLMCSSMKTSEIGYEVGYKDPHYFSYIFKKTQGCSPKEYRSRGKE
ncbi:MAG: response regulator [Dorea sp.]